MLQTNLEVLATVDQQGNTQELLRFQGAIAKDDLESMEHAIEESCEKINCDVW